METPRNLINSGRVKKFEGEEKWLVDNSLINNYRITEDGKYLVDDVVGVTSRKFDVPELIFDEEPLTSEKISEAIKARAVFIIIDDGNKYPGYLTLIPIKTPQVAKKVIEDIREENQATVIDDDEEYLEYLSTAEEIDEN